MSGALLLLRRAARLARRAPLRSLATGFVVAAAVFAGALWTSESRGHHERYSGLSPELGAADAHYQLWVEGPEGDTLPPLETQIGAVVDALPDGSDAAVLRTFDLVIGTAQPLNYVTAQQGPWGDPLLRPMVALAAGRLPGRGEVVVSPALAVASGLDLGDELVVREPAAVLEVVGLGAARPWADLLVDEDEFIPTASEHGTAAPDVLASAAVLAALPPGVGAPEPVLDGPDGGYRVVTPFRRADVTSSPPSGVSVTVLLVVAAFVGLSAGSAFGIGAARRRRALGLLATNGATEAQLRFAVASEAMVVAAPAVLVGILGAVALAPAWVRGRLPGWEWIWQATVPWGWVGLLGAAAVAAAVGGAIAFSRSVYAAPATDLLDRRQPIQHQRARRPLPSAVVLLLCLLAVPLVLPLFAVFGAASIGRSWTLLASVAGWLLGVGLVVTATRRLLARHPVGRLVGRDLARRRLGAVAAVIVVGVWTFAAIMWTVSPGLGSGDASQLSASSDRVAAEERSSATGGQPAPVRFPAAADSTTLTISPQPPSSMRHRSNPHGPPSRPAWPEGLRDQLADAGLTTSRATIGQFSGECPVCPSGYLPRVIVLDSPDGLDLPDATASALRDGKVVSGVDVGGVDGSTIGGRQVVVSALPFATEGALLAEPSADGSQLEQPVEVLVGATAGLSDDQLDAVVALAAAAGAEVTGNDPRLGTDAWITIGLSGWIDPPYSWRPAWVLSALLLLLVTLAATAAHRREHGETAHVLWVLGADPGVARRLSGITAGALAGAGTAIGALTALIAVVATLTGRADPDEFWSSTGPRQLATMLALVVLVPLVVAGAGRLLPPPRHEFDETVA